MVRYDTPSEEDQNKSQEFPPYDKAGIRCVELIKERFPDKPVILFTILDQEDLSEEIKGKDVVFVAKESNLETLFTNCGKNFARSFLSFGLRWNTILLFLRTRIG